MNASTITEFVVREFTSSHTVRVFLFTLVFPLYTIALVGNLLIIMMVWSDPKLYQCPMYFFLANLSLLDITLGSVAAPKLLTVLLNGGQTISYGGCMAQILAFHLSGAAEMLLLTVMAYDRYVAICHPLRYTLIMDRQRCFSLIILCWTGGLIHAIFQTVVTAQIPLCGPSVLDSFFCEITQVKKLACSDIRVSELLFMLSDNVIIVPSFLTLLVSYVSILVTLCGRFQKSGRKGLSTCGSHLTIVFLFYGPIVFVYTNPSSNSQADKMAPVFYTVVSPALNPLIYTLRNKEVKGAVRRLKSKCKHFLLLQLE